MNSEVHTHLTLRARLSRDFKGAMNTKANPTMNVNEWKLTLAEYKYFQYELLAPDQQAQCGFFLKFFVF